MKNLLRASIARRLLFTLIFAFFMVGVVLIGQDYWQFETSIKQKADLVLKGLGDSLVQSLGEMSDARQVRAAASTLLRINNERLSREGHPDYSLWVQIRDQQGSAVYFSPPTPVLPTDSALGAVRRRVVEGQKLRLYTGSNNGWQIVIAQRELQYSSFFNLWNGFGIYLLIAFPFVLLPILWAIFKGLYPLRILSAHIEQRAPNDLSLIALDMPQVELQPIVAAINGLLSELKKSLEQEKSFVHDAAHELQTPLAGVLAQAHVLSRQVEKSEKHEAMLRMEKSIARISHLIRQLLLLDRLDAGTALAREAVDVAWLAREILTQRAREADAKGIEFVLNSPDAMVFVTSQQALFSILDNLIANALKYVPQGSLIQVDIQHTGDSLLFRVADNGPGIPEHEREKVFNRFYRAQGQETTGAGLGLAIVRQATTALGGTVILGPGLDDGGCGFEVRIPA